MVEGVKTVHELTNSSFEPAAGDPTRTQRKKIRGKIAARNSKEGSHWLAVPCPTSRSLPQALGSARYRALGRGDPTADGASGT